MSKSGSVLTGHHEQATGQDSNGNDVTAYGSTREEAVENCRDSGSVTEPVVKK